MKDTLFDHASTQHVRAQHGHRKERMLNGALVQLNGRISTADRDDFVAWAAEYQISQGGLLARLIATHRRQRAKKLSIARLPHER